ncbi:unnamed protein product [Paramecium pentaurelia]|uniref:Beta-lactamase-related domain-containing protein n=1 Tax=Paramecium pentaurelia TaxID=43138 RepID=A0A8S1VEZ9_9CILI|nr:unnamed protein product [Paramecium pentaurelia]
MKQNNFLPSLITVLLIISANCVTKDDLISQLTEKLDIMDNKMSILIQGADGSIYLKEHLSSEGTQPYDDNTTIHIASGCKWIAMATIMKLVELQLLSLDTKVTDIYPEFQNTNPTMTLKNLMTHTSGYQLADEWVFDLNISLQESVLGIAKGGQYPASKVYFPGGTKVGYSDIGMQIAGGMAEKVSGKTFHELFDEYIAIPMGMKNAKFTAFDGETGNNIAIADGLLIRMIDYGNFLRMLLNEGYFDGKNILLASTVQTMLQDHTGDLPVSDEVMEEVVGEVEDSYSFAIGAWVYDRDSDDKPSIYSSPGIHGFENWIDVENNYLCILYIRTDTDNEPEVTDLTEAIRPDILEFYLDESGNYSNLIYLGVLFVFVIMF